MDETPAQAYLAAVATLWPGRPEPRWDQRPETTGSAESIELLAVPHARSPRLLVPGNNPRAAAAAMHRFSAALAVADTVKRLGVSAVLRAGARPSRAAFRDRIVVAERAGSLRSYLADVVGEPVDFSLGIGTARANRKPVLQVFDKRGRAIGFAKIGDNSLTRPLVAGEAAALQRLAEADLPDWLEIPELLHSGSWEGAAVLLMSPVDTSFRQRPKRQFEVPSQAMDAFHRGLGQERGRLSDSALWQASVEELSTLSETPELDQLRDAVSALSVAAESHEVELGAWHGDWTPWNMSRRGTRVQLWDFERFAEGAPRGLDRAHYGVNAVTRRDGTDVAAVLRGLRLAGFDEGRPGADHLVAAAYLAVITTRYLAGVETERGAAVVDRCRVLLQALRTWTGVTR